MAERKTPSLDMAQKTLEFLPRRQTLSQLRTAVQDCKGCPLHLQATQAVFGEGKPTARLVVVGEIPGDKEDQEGRPFVGPAGRLLEELLREAGIGRKEAYLTNAVKHFKWAGRSGPRRLHAKPSASEIAACRPWLAAEIEAISPAVIICLGATAAQALLGRSFRITIQHGEVLRSEWAGCRVVATYHPAASLRAPKESDRDRLRAEILHDLRLARSLLRP